MPANESLSMPPGCLQVHLMATPHIGRPDVLAAIRAGGPAPAWRDAPIPRDQLAPRIEELRTALARLMHLVPSLGRYVRRDEPRRERLNAIHDQALALCGELGRLAEELE
jgi:hypothetical protein